MIANLYNPVGESFHNVICKILSYESNWRQFTIFNQYCYFFFSTPPIQFSFIFSFKILTVDTSETLAIYNDLFGVDIFFWNHMLFCYCEYFSLYMLANLKLSYVFTSSRMRMAWCRNAARVRPAYRAEPPFVFTNHCASLVILHAPPGYIFSHSTIIYAHLTAEQQIFDYSFMSAVRTAVEWVFGDVMFNLLCITWVLEKS